MLDYLVKASVRRRLFRVLWGEGASGSVSELARRARVAFSAAHRELQAMSEAGLASAERVGAEVVYRANDEHPYAQLLTGLATAPEHPDVRANPDRDEHVRGWLTSAGASLAAAMPPGRPPSLEDVVLSGLELSHRDSTVARVMPLVLWRQRGQLDFDRLRAEATRRNEAPTLGYFLELAGKLGHEPDLLRESAALRDRRRKRARQFFSDVPGPRALAAMRRSTPREARRWGFLMNMGVDSFRSAFDKHVQSP